MHDYIRLNQPLYEDSESKTSWLHVPVSVLLISVLS